MEQININFTPYSIQYKALEYLWDKEHTQIFFGGAARVSKTYLAVAFATIECLSKPGIHIGIGRSRLSYLKKTTLLTLFEFFKHQNIKEGKHFDYNKQDGILTFKNGSKILFLELYDNPSDPFFERLLSLSLTHCIIDEASQVSKMAYDTLSSRISYKLKEYNITGKLLVVSNPTRGWLKTEFYDKYKNGTLENDKVVILGTPLDNPSAGKEYIEQQLKILNEPMAQRLIYGNWEYSEEDYNLFKYEDILNCFYNEIKTDNNHYLSCDISNGANDYSSLVVWRGMEIIKIVKLKEKTDIVEKKIKELISQFKINIKNVVVDYDGVGVGIGNNLKGCFKFQNNSKALNGENFANLKTQCILKLSDFIKNNNIKLLEEFRDDIIREFSVIKYSDKDKDRIEIESKELQKKRLGHSPDLFDSIMMRMIFTFKQFNKIVFI